MRPRILLSIYRKEVLEALRDRRTLFMMIALPILLYPLLMIGMSRLQEGQAAAQTAKTSNIAIWGNLPPGFASYLKDKSKVVLMPWAGATPEVRKGIEEGQFDVPPKLPLDLDADEEPPKPKKLPDTPWAHAAQKAVLNREVDAVVILWQGFDRQITESDAGVITVLFDSVRPESRKARDRMSDYIRLYREDLVKTRVEQRKLAPGFAQAIDFQSTNVASEQRKSGMFVGMLLPYMLILFSAMSGFYAAIDMTAGEKERGTMQTLLCAPVESLEIITGKFGAVWTIATIATIVNLLSLAMTFSRLKLIPGMQMTIPPASYVIAFIMLLPISLMVNAVFLAVGAFAKDFKDGQNFLTPLLMSLIIPLMVTMAPGVELNGYLAFVPVVNIALLIKGIFLGEWAVDMLFLVTLSSLCYASLALLFAANVFERNAVLLGGKEGLSSVFDFGRRAGSRPTPGVSLLTFAVVLVLAFYGSLSLVDFGIPVTLAATQYGMFLLPCLLLVRMKGYDPLETLSLRAPSVRAVLGATLIGVSAWTVAGGLLVRLLPPPESLTRALERLLMLDDKAVPLWQVWLLIAITPAICEETLFRGLILSGFRRLGKWPAILITGLLFGLAHASIYRLLPTMALGVILGWMVWRTGSIVPAMISHALNNGLMATLTRSKGLVEALGLTGAKYVPWTAIGIGSLVLAAGVWLISGERQEETNS